MLEYKMESKTKPSLIDTKDASFNAPSAMELDSTATSSEMDQLTEQIKRKYEAREAIKAERGKEKTASVSPASMQSSNRKTTNLRIDGIPVWWTSQALLHDFSCYGHVLATKVTRPRFEDRRTTGGYILFSHRSAAELALFEKKMTSYAGELITLDWTSPPSDTTGNRHTKTLRSGTANNDEDIFNSESGLVSPYLKHETYTLNEDDVATFTALLHDLTAARSSISHLMEWMILHESCAAHVTQLWVNATCIPTSSTPSLANKVALIFLASDLLCNISSILKQTNSSYEAHSASDPELASTSDFKHLWVYRASFYRILPYTMRVLGRRRKEIPGRLSAQTFDGYIVSVLNSWRKLNIFTSKYLDMLTKIFAEPDSKHTTEVHSNDLSALTIQSVAPKSSEMPSNQHKEIIDGTPISDYRGLPIDFEAAIDEELTRILQHPVPYTM